MCDNARRASGLIAIIKPSEYMNALNEAVKFSAMRLVDTNKTGQF